MRDVWLKLAPSERLCAVLLALLVCLGSWVFLGGHARYGLFDVDEAIFTEATLEMRQNTEIHGVSGLAMPTYNGEPRYHKPPLIYWAQSGLMSVLGESSLYAARLPSALSAVALVLLLGWWVFRLTGNRAWAVASSVAMAFNLSFVVVGRAATADGVLNLSSFMLGAWVVYILLKPTPPWRWVVTGTLAALGMLAKGPIAWFPALLVGLWMLAFSRNRAVVWAKLAPFRVLLVMMVVLTPWLLLLVKQHGLGFFYEFIMVHNINRYASGLTNTQSTSPFYYVAVLLVGFFPWVLMLPPALAGLYRALRKSAKGPMAPVLTQAMEARNPELALVTLCAVWGVVYVLFFSFSQTKLAHYIVPAYPALAVLVGWLASRAGAGEAVYRAKTGRWRYPAWLMASMAVLGSLLVLVFAGVFGVLNPLLEGLRGPVLHGKLAWLQLALGFTWPPKDPITTAVLALPVALDPAPEWIAGVLLFAVLPMLGMAVMRPRLERMLALGVAWAACLVLVVAGVVPTIWGYTQAPLARLAAMEAQAPDVVRLVHLGLHKPSVMYFSGRAFTKLEKPLQLPDALITPETWVLTPASKVPGIVAELDVRGGAAVVGERCDGGYCLLNVARLHP